MTRTHLFERIQWAHQNLDPVQPSYAVVWDDPNDLDAPSKITTPAPEWLSMAMYGGLLPPVEAYHKIEFGCWSKQAFGMKDVTTLRYVQGGMQTVQEELEKLTDEERTEEKVEELSNKYNHYKQVADNLLEKIKEEQQPEAVFVGIHKGERQAKEWVEQNGGFYRIINYEPVHGSTPLGPMTEEEAMEYLIQKDIPEEVWADKYQGNSRRFVICKRNQLPQTREWRNAWKLRQDMGV